MDSIVNILKTLAEHSGDIAAAVVAFLAFASIVVKFTKTPKDDEVLGKVKDFLLQFSIFNHKDAVVTTVDKVDKLVTDVRTDAGVATAVKVLNVLTKPKE
jgi:hypothetical protein